MRTIVMVLFALVGCSPAARSGVGGNEGGAGELSGEGGFGGIAEEMPVETTATPSQGGAPSAPVDEPTEALGGFGGTYWGPWICKQIPGGTQCARYPIDSGAYD